MDIVAVFVGGGLGALTRLFLNKACAPFWQDFPVATILSNLIACLILGFAMGVFANRPNTQTWLKAGLTTGFCGGFSTFSTFGYETLSIAEGGRLGIAGLYILASMALCLLGVWFGQIIGRQV